MSMKSRSLAMALAGLFMASTWFALLVFLKVDHVCAGWRFREQLFDVERGECVGVFEHYLKECGVGAVHFVEVGF